MSNITKLIKGASYSDTMEQLLITDLNQDVINYIEKFLDAASLTVWTFVFYKSSNESNLDDQIYKYSVPFVGLFKRKINMHRICSCSAKAGNLPLLKWARANECPWDIWTCSDAAAGGHLELLKWARANGCPWGSETCSSAAYWGLSEILQWARANGCPDDDDDD